MAPPPRAERDPAPAAGRRLENRSAPGQGESARQRPSPQTPDAALVSGTRPTCRAGVTESLSPGAAPFRGAV